MHIRTTVWPKAALQRLGLRTRVYALLGGLLLVNLTGPAIMDRFGRIVIGEALSATGGNRSQAAKLLGLSRPTLLAKIEKYGLRVEAKVLGGQG